MANPTGSVYEYVKGLEKDLPMEEARKEASRQLGMDVGSLSTRDLSGDVSHWFGPTQSEALPPVWQSEFDEADAEKRSLAVEQTPSHQAPPGSPPGLRLAPTYTAGPEGVTASGGYQQQTPRDIEHEVQQQFADINQQTTKIMRDHYRIEDAVESLWRKRENNDTVWDDVASVLEYAYAPMAGVPYILATDNPTSRGTARMTGTAGRLAAEVIDEVLGTELTPSGDEAKAVHAKYDVAMREASRVVKERIDRRHTLGVDEVINLGEDAKDLVEGVASIAGFYTGLTSSDIKGFSDNVSAGWDMGGELMAAIAADVASLFGTDEGNWLDTIRTRPLTTLLTAVPIARALTALKGLSKVRGINGAKLKAKAKAFLNKWDTKYNEIMGRNLRALGDEAPQPMMPPAVTPPMPKELMSMPQRAWEGAKSVGKKVSDFERAVSNPAGLALAGARKLKGKLPKVRESLAEHSEADVQSALYDYERGATNIGDQAGGILEREVLRTGEEPSKIGLDVDLESGVSLKERSDSPEVAPPGPSEGMTPGATLTMPPTIRRIAEADRARGREGRSPAERYWDIARQEALSGERKTYGVMLKTYDFTLNELKELARNPEELRAVAIRKGIEVFDDTSPQQMLADLAEVGTEEKRIAIDTSQEAPAGLKWVNRDTESPSLAPIDDSASAKELWRPGDQLRGYVASGKMQSDIASSPSGSRFQLVNEAGRLDYGIVVEMWKDLWEGHGRGPRPNRNELSTKQIVELTEFINDQTGLDTRGVAKTNIPYDRPTMARSAETQQKLVEGEQRGGVSKRAFGKRRVNFRPCLGSEGPGYAIFLERRLRYKAGQDGRRGRTRDEAPRGQDKGP